MTFGLLSFLGGRVPLSGDLNISINDPGTGYIVATGGTIYEIGVEKYHVFTQNASFLVTSVGPTVEGSSIKYLMVGGGGGGGYDLCGGGGGGGVLYNLSRPITPGSYAVTVGVGGAGSTSGSTPGANGAPSIFYSETAGGGGGGASRSSIAQQGANGGGGSADGPSTGAQGIAPTSAVVGTVIYGGYKGGNGGGGAPTYPGGGGAGAGGNGSNATSGQGGPGGTGVLVPFMSQNWYWAGGGGGSNYNNGPKGGDGGAGGGGGGASQGGTPGTGGSGGFNPGQRGGATPIYSPGGDGGFYTGSGGGAGHNNYSNGGSGGPGIVIIGYRFKT